MTHQKTVLSNGLTIISQHNEKSVSTLLNFWVKAGGHYEKGFPYGIAHFLEHMMFKGTKNRHRDEIIESIDEIGGRFNASTFVDKTHFYTTVPYDMWETGVTILADMIFHSTFPIEEMEKEKKVVLEEIKRSQDDPSGYASRLLLETLRSNHPERASVLGTPESVSSITRDDLLRFVATYYQPHNLVFVATGNIHHEALVTLLEQATPAKQGSTIFEQPLPFAARSVGGTVTIKRDIKQAHIRWGIPGPNALHEEFFTAEVISHVLGGGMSSRFFKKIREEKGLAYATSAGYLANADEGFMLGYAGVNHANITEVKMLIIDELESLKTQMVTDKELNRVKNANIGHFLISQDDKEQINLNLAVEHMMKISGDPYSYAKGIRAVTAEDINKYANKYFHPTKIQFVEVVPIL
jgi:predicted Zn-dependent peptidase